MRKLAYLILCGSLVCAALEIPIRTSISKAVLGENGDLYVVGMVSEAGLPVSESALQKAPGGGLCISTIGAPQRPCNDFYLQRWSGRDGRLLAATYWGGERDEFLGDISVDPEGNLYLAGASDSAVAGYGPGRRNLLLVLDSEFRIQKLAHRYAFTGGFGGMVWKDGKVWLGGTAQEDLVTAGRIPQPAYGGGYADLLLMRVDARTGEPEYATWVGGEDTETFAAMSIGESGRIWLAANAPARVWGLEAGGGSILWERRLTEASFLSSISGWGEGAVIGGRGQDQGFLVRVREAAGGWQETAVGLGDTVRSLHASSGGIWIAGESFGGLQTSRHAPLRCAPGGLDVFVARWEESQSRPSFVSYLGTAQPDQFGAFADGLLAWRTPQKWVLQRLPEPTEENSICLEATAVNLAAAQASPAALNYLGEQRLSPGAFLTLFGAGFEDESKNSSAIPGIAREWRGLRVLWNGSPLGILELSEKRVSVALPFSLVGGSSGKIVLERNGRRSEEREFRVVENAPMMLTPERLGPGQLAVYDREGRLLDQKNPARPGEVVTVYLSGAGRLDREIDETQVVEEGPLPQLAARLSAEALGIDKMEVLSASAMYGQLPGLVQVNLRLGHSFTGTRAYLLRLRVGNSETEGVFWGTP